MINKALFVFLIVALVSGCIMEWDVERSSEARASNNPETCKIIISDEQRDDCYIELGRRLKKISLCDSVEAIGKRHFCKAMIRSDESYCMRITNDNDADECNLNIAELNAEPGICQKIKDQDIRDLCYLQSGMKKKDIKACELIIDPTKKKTCEDTINEL